MKSAREKWNTRADQAAREERYDARIDALMADRDAALDARNTLLQHLDEARRELRRKHERAEAAEKRGRDVRAEIERLREQLENLLRSTPDNVVFGDNWEAWLRVRVFAELGGRGIP